MSFFFLILFVMGEFIVGLLELMLMLFVNVGMYVRLGIEMNEFFWKGFYL